MDFYIFSKKSFEFCFKLYNIMKIALIKTKMKIKAIYFLSVFLLFWVSLTHANDLSVRSNIESGSYDFALEVYLVSNDKNAKIFYYTDGIGRFDTLKEFNKNNPILIKKDTTLNYYAINEINNSTKIAESKYSFSYPKNIEISHKENTIFITNNSQKTLNIWYFKIESNLLNYEISKNTFLESWENFTLKYSPKKDDILTLFAPNGEKISSFEISLPSPPERRAGDEGINTQSGITTISETQTGNTQSLPLETQAEIITSPIIATQDLKASVWETKNSSTNIYVLLYWFVAFLFAMTLFNIYTLVKANKNIKNKNKKTVKK